MRWSRDAHAPGMRVIVDIVPNHCSDQHAWFQEAWRPARGARARARYIFRTGEGPDGTRAPPNDWPWRQFGGQAWTQVVGRTAREWYLHLFTPEQPDFELGATRRSVEEFDSILRFWLDRGVDGFRIDVAHGLAKDDREPLARPRAAERQRREQPRPRAGQPDVGPRRRPRDLPAAGDEILDSYDG